MAIDTEDRAHVESEFEEARQAAKSYTPEELRDGGWFVRVLASALRTYAEHVDAEWFRAKYPGLPPDAVADRRIELACRYAAIEGGISALAYSGSVAATIGSAGALSPLSLPAGVLTFAADLFYVTRLQLYLAYDLSILYGHPIDLDDPEDLYDLLRVAFGVKAGEVFRTGIARLAPEATRIGVKAVAQGATLAWLKALPVVGKYLLQRNIVKFAIPVVAVPISAFFNHYSTGAIGEMARRVYRDKAAIREFADSIDIDASEDPLLLLQVMYLVVRADGKVSAEESWLLDAVTRELGLTEAGQAAVDRFRVAVDVSEAPVFAAVAGLAPEYRALVLDSATRAASVDHSLGKAEAAVLRRLATACSVNFDPKHGFQA